MITPKQIAARFYKALKEKEHEYGKGYNKFLHLETNLSTGYLSQILSGEKPGSQDAQIKICDAAGIDYNDLLKEPERPAVSEQASNVTTLKRHQDILSEFQNQTLALEVNKKLIEAEKVDPNILVEVIGYINGRLGAAKEQHAKNHPAPQQKSSAS